MARELKLHSPAGSEPDVYQWTEDREAGQIDVGVELVDTIRLVYQEFPGVMVESDLFTNYDTNSFHSMNNLVDKYNNSIDAYLQRNPTHPNERLVRMQSSSSRKLLRHILQQVYKHAVADPEKLRHYKPFSPEVYGETSFELVCQIIDRVNVTEEDIFIDLGSGVGQIVLQVAASTPCKMVWGIEKADWPSFFAEQMDSHFKRLMCWWGKPYREYQLIKGDFLDQCHSEKLSSASVIFVNNCIFGPQLDQQLKERFTELRDGARIVSSKEFCPLNFNINERNLSDIGSIMDVTLLSTFKDSVSWTAKSVNYFLHTINRAKLELYFNPLKGKENTPNPRTSRTKKDVDQVLQSDTSSKMVVRQSSDVGGPRTRRARQEEAKKSGKSDAIATVACNSAGKPVGRVGRRRRNPAINKKSIPEVASSLPCNISDVTVSLPRLPDQQVAMVDETNNIPSVEMYVDKFRMDLVSKISLIKDPEYRQYLTTEIERERQRNAKLTLEMAELNQEIASLMITENMLTLHRQQREEMCRDIELSRAVTVDGEIAVVYQESVLKQIRSSMTFFKKLDCQIRKLSAAKITSNRTTTVFRPSVPRSTANYSSAPFQPPNDCTPCVNQVLLGFDLEDNLKNLAISALNYNANLAAKKMNQLFDYSSKNKTKVHSNTREV